MYVTTNGAHDVRLLNTCIDKTVSSVSSTGFRCLRAIIKEPLMYVVLQQHQVVWLRGQGTVRDNVTHSLSVTFQRSHCKLHVLCETISSAPHVGALTVRGHVV